MVKTIWLRLIFFLLIIPVFCTAQSFVHPGISQSKADLDYMRRLVKEGRQPWKDAFERLRTSTDAAFIAKPFAHVLRGPYGKPNVGGDELSRSAQMAYNNALLWYITGEKQYADKAIKILDAWSPVLWDFDYNDAKLLAAWTGHQLCNAAEILRYSNAGWQPAAIARFSNMLNSVYYPLLRYYFPQANGNWDGAIIHTLMAIAIFTDNRPLFNNALDHFLHGPVNGSLFKYIYPSGQCQESMRDQGHVQLGLGEFAGAAQVAFTQGKDLFSIGQNRLALGYEYTARFLLGDTPHCYGIISQRAKNLRDDYEYVYNHYKAMGLQLPNVKIAADSMRSKATRSVLTSVRVPGAIKKQEALVLEPPVKEIAGAEAARSMPAGAIKVEPGQSVQDALNSAAAVGKVVWLAPGIHTLSASLQIPSNTSISGAGLETILFLDPSSSSRDVIINAGDDMQNVQISDLIIEAGRKTETGTDPNSGRSYRGGYNRGGILFRASGPGKMKRILLTRITVRNATYNGISISGADEVRIQQCDLSENGGNAIPGPRLQHNLLLNHCNQIAIENNRMVTSPYGSGLCVDHCAEVKIERNEISRNAYHGIQVMESNMIKIKDNFIEGNDMNGIRLEWLAMGCSQIKISGNVIQFNGQYAIESYAAASLLANKNREAGNGNAGNQEKISQEKLMLAPVSCN